MNQKNKNILLIVGLILFWILAYAFGFSKTIDLIAQNDKLQAQKEIHQSAPAQLAALAKKEKQLNEILAKNNVEGSSVQNNLLKTLQNLSSTSDFMVVNFEEPHVSVDEPSNKVTTTYNFTLEGDYKSLLSVVYALEQKYSFGNIVHTGFEKKKNYRTRKNYLQCNVLLQRLN